MINDVKELEYIVRRLNFYIDEIEDEILYENEHSSCAKLDAGLCPEGECSDKVLRLNIL